MQRWYSGPGRWMRYEILEKDTEIRLDRWLRQTFPSLTHSHVQKLIRTRKIRLLQDEKHIPTTSNALLMKGILIAFDSYLFDQISMEQTHETKRNKVQQLDHKMEKKLLQSIVYEDENYIILDKPNDIAVQDGSGLKHSLMTYLPSFFSKQFGGDVPKIVHRLDKETSGLLVVARHRLAAARFSAILREGLVKKTYQALVTTQLSTIPEMGRIEYPIDGKKATTIYKQLPWTDRRGVWLQLHPITGRKHQLRIHCAKYLEAPIYGDAKYRKLLSLPPIPTDRLYLHANHIQFLNPFHSTQEISVSSRKSIYSNTSK